MDLTSSERESLYSAIHKSPADDCWIWTGDCDEAGEPSYFFRGKSTAVSVLMYRLYFRKMVQGTSQIYRNCNNRLCVNPMHMQLTSHHIHDGDAAEIPRIEKR